MTVKFRTNDEMRQAGASTDDIYAEARAVWNRMEYLARADKDGTASADDQREYNALDAIHNGLMNAAENDQEFMRQQRASLNVGSLPAARDPRSPVLAKDQSFTAWARAEHLIPQVHDDAERPMEFGRYIKGLVTGQWEDADREHQAMQATTVPAQILASMSEGTLTAGGFAVPTVLSTGLIDLARNRTRVLEAGASVVPMKSGTVNLAKWSGDQGVAWHTENALISATDATLARVQLVAKTLSGIVVASRELIEDADPADLDGQLKEAFAAQVALAIDYAALYGPGTGGQPTGIKSTSGVTVSPLAANGASLTSWAPFVNALYTVKSANEDPTAFILSPRTAKNAALLVDTTNQPLNPPSYLDDVPRLETAQVPGNLVVGTSGSTTSDLFVGDFRQLLIGQRTQFGVSVLTERYAEFGQLGFLVWWRGDIAVTRPAAFAVTTGIL